MTPKIPEHLSLTHLPTPIEPLSRLTKQLKGPNLYIKRDDLAGIGAGGSSSRKLDFLLAEAQTQQYDHVVTVGRPQSNHCCQTAVAAAKLGLGCSLILQGNEADYTQQDGNLRLSQLCGAHLYWTNGVDTKDVIQSVLKQIQTFGRNPYFIPLGGSNVVGTTAYVQAMKELMEQIQSQNLNIDVIVLASNSGGMQAGLVLGAQIYGFRGEIFGVSVYRTAEDLKMQIGALATATAAHLGLRPPNLMDRVVVNDDYIEPGYGAVTEVEADAMTLLAEKEGLFLDPVYTGRAMGGLIDLIRWGAFTRAQRILFWYTGGQPLHA